MNVNTGHLITSEMFQAMQEFQREEYTPVPKELHSSADKKLAGKSEAVVSLTSGGRLSKWASKQRKNKSKVVKESRKRNRK